MTIDIKPIHGASIVGDFVGARLGRVVGASSDGHPLVAIIESTAKPAVARVALYGLDDPKPLIDDCASVVLVFENADPGRPIIVGVIGAGENGNRRVRQKMSQPAEPIDKIEGDVQEIVIEAEDRIVLKVGKASITIMEDGRIITRATNIISRASAVNDIKGASVRIN